MSALRAAATAFVLILAVRPAAAGVPLYLDADGRPARHLVPVVSNPTTPASVPSLGGELAQLVADAGARWAAESTAQIAFEAGAPLVQAITSSNYLQVLAVCGDGLSPLVADPDGAIVDDLFGEGASESILGVGISDCETGDGVIEEHSMLVNFAILPLGTAAGRALAERVVTHELGHVIGLAHSFLNFEFLGDGNGANDVHLPMMFPVLSEDDPLLPPLLHLDDTSMHALLYPAAGFVPATATVAGLARLPPAGRAVSGTFLAVRNTSDPLGTAIFTASGLTPTGVVLGAPFAALDQLGEPRGAFQATGLPPGDYTLEVLGGVNAEYAEFYNGAAESHDPLADPPAAAAVLTLAAGEVVADAHVLLDQDPLTAGAKAADTNWTVSWRGRAKVPGQRVKLGPEFLPPPGPLDLLATGGWTLRSGSTLFDALLSGVWTPAISRRGASPRRFVHVPADPDTVLAFASALFGGDAVFSEVEARGSTNGRKVRGSLTVRGEFVASPRSPRLTLALKYKGVPRSVPVEAGPVPPLAPVAVVVTPALAAVAPGAQVVFSAAVEGASGGVTWETLGPGSIDAGGVFTAPASGAERTHVFARSTGDPRAVGLAAADVAP